MKSIIALFLIINGCFVATAQVVLAQESRPQESRPQEGGPQEGGPQEGRALNNTDEQLRRRNAPDLFVLGVSASGRDSKGRTSFFIEVQNLGNKTITAFDWEYAPRPGVGKYREGSPMKLRSASEKIRPGEKKKLTERVSEYTEELVTSFRLNSIRIMRVEYEDGSSWQRPAEETK